MVAFTRLIQSGHLEKENNVLAPLGIQPWIVQPVKKSLSSHTKDHVYVQSQKAIILKINSISDVVFFLLGDFPVPEFYELTFWNTRIPQQSHPSYSSRLHRL